jgi:hypothetical protein
MASFSVDRMPKKFRKRYKSVLTILVALAAFLAIAFLFLVNGNVLVRFVLAIFVLMVSGHVIAVTNGLKDSYGAYLLGGKHGIKFIESLAKKSPRFWTALADWGLVVGFGLLSYLLFRKYVSKKMMLAGMVSMLAILIFVYPYLPIVLSFINIPQITSKLSSVPATQGVSPFYYLFLAASVIGGFSASTILLVLYSGGSILFTTLLFLTGLLSAKPNYSILTQQIPGVAPLIPGLTIPLFAGIISLFILLVVHEFSHGVLAKIAKVKIKSIGAILFGIVPLGAFVEPDEREVKRLKESHQNRISVAGVSANMLTSIFFFVIAFVFLSYVLPNVNTHGVLVVETVKNLSAYGVIAVNSTIVGWNNVTIRNSFDLAKAEGSYVPGTPVKVATSSGVFSLMPNSQGKLGIIVEPAQMTLTYQATNFLYAIAALSFGLNFFVAIFNLLPIPSFDGWRIYQSKIKSKKLLNAIAAVIIITILLNILPWFWTIG